MTYQDILDNYSPLTKEQEKTATNTELVLHNFRFMFKQFSKFLGELDANEYVSEIYAGMYDAANRWDKTKDMKFFTFAKNYVYLYLLNYSRNKNEALTYPASQQNRISGFKKFIHEFSIKHHRLPNAEDVKIGLGFNRKLYNRYMRYCNYITGPLDGPEAISLVPERKSVGVSDNKEGFSLDNILSKGDLEGEDEEFLNEQIEKLELKAYIDNFLASSDDNTRRVLLEIYFEGKTIGNIAKSMNMSIKIIKEIHNKAIEELRIILN